MNLADIGKQFRWEPTDYGGRLVTPWCYDDGDQVVVFARREGINWRFDDNGEGLFRLAAAGVDPESDRVQARLAAFPSLMDVHLADDRESLYAVALPGEAERAALAVAEASAQVLALSALRQVAQPSDFRPRVVSIVEDVARRFGIEARRDVATDESQSLLADVYLCSPTPVLVIAATSTQRLMEAEIIWLDAARRQAPAYVLATVESARAIGINQYTRANYYTDKTVEFSGAKALGDLVAARLRH